MKKEISKRADFEKDNMRPEYDFANMTGGVRGKYYKAYRAGHTVKIDKADGTIEVRRFKPEEAAIMLEPDVLEYFPDSEAVNNALRCLIPLIQKKTWRKRKAKEKQKKSLAA